MAKKVIISHKSIGFETIRKNLGDRLHKKHHNMRTIILDNPHGIDTPGKRSPDGKHREYLWGRNMLNEIAQNLINLGVSVIHSNVYEYEIGFKKRVEVMNRIPSNAFVFSLHNNAAGMGDKWLSARNPSIYTCRGETQSDTFATMIYEQIIKDIPEIPWRKDMVDGDIDYEANFAVLMSKHPSALLEWLFQDNKEDVALLNDEKLNERLVNALTEVLFEISIA